MTSERISVDPAPSACDKPAGTAARISDRPCRSVFTRLAESWPGLAFPRTPSVSGAARDNSLVAEAELTPDDFATTSATDALLEPKIFPSSCCPAPIILLVALPPLNSEDALPATASYPLLRIRAETLLAPSREDTVLTNPLSTLGTAAFRALRVEKDGTCCRRSSDPRRRVRPRRDRAGYDSASAGRT